MDSEISLQAARTVGIIQMVRNVVPAALLNRPPSAVAENRTDYYRYYLYDYFDSLSFASTDMLTEKSLNPDGYPLYQFHFGVNNPFDQAEAIPTISQQIITLVSRDGDSGRTRRLFSYPNAGSTVLTDRPYLVIVSIACVPTVGCETCLEHEDVENIIRGCLARTLNDQCVYELFLSATSGDYCVAVRTSDIAAAYRAALSLRTFSDEQPNPSIKFHTFSTVGVVCPLNMWDRAPELAAELRSCVNACDTYEDAAAQYELVIRLHVRSAEAIAKLDAANYRSSYDGLYGRYDLSIDISQKQFWVLYPILAFSKLEPQPIANFLNYPDIQQFVRDNSDPLVEALYACILANQVDVINVRTVLNISDGTPPSFNAKAPLNMSPQLRRMRDSIMDLKRRSYIVTYYHEKFVEYLEQLDDIRMCYQNMQYEPDSEINGVVFYSQFELICMSIDRYIKLIQVRSEDQSSFHNVASICRDLNEYMMYAVESLNSFNKLVQSRNLQSIQSPNFEMQMSIDMEKYLIAYSEFLQEFTARHHAHFCEPAHGAIQPVKSIPVFSINRMEEGVRGTALFPDPIESYHEPFSENFSTDDPLPVFMSITAPSTLSFAKIHETLPIILHEISHQFRFIPSEKRNQALLDYLLYSISERIAAQWVDYLKCGDANIYISDVYRQLVAKKIYGALCHGFEQVSQNAPDVMCYRLDVFKDLVKEYLVIAAFSAGGSMGFVNAKKAANHFRTAIIDMVQACYHMLPDQTKSLYMQRVCALAQKDLPADESRAILAAFSQNHCLHDMVYSGYKMIAERLAERLKRLKPCMASDETAQSDIATFIKNTLVCFDQHILFEPTEVASQAIEVSYHKACENLANAGVLEDIPEYVRDLLAPAVKDFFKELHDLNHLCAGFVRARDIWKFVQDYPDALMNVDATDFPALHDEVIAELKQTYAKDYPSAVGSLAYIETLSNADGDLQIRDTIERFMFVYAGQVQSQIDDYLEVYREVFADLCMCAAMGFTAIGYL